MERTKYQFLAVVAVFAYAQVYADSPFSAVDWSKIDSQTTTNLKCRNHHIFKDSTIFNGSIFHCEKSAQAIGPYVSLNESGKIIQKGYMDRLGSDYIENKIEYDDSGAIIRQVSQIDGLPFGTELSFWKKNILRAKLEYSSIDEVLERERADGFPTVLLKSSTFWDDQGKPVSSTMLPLDCTELSDQNSSCAWKSVKREVTAFVGHNPGEVGMIAIVDLPLSGMTMYFLRENLLGALAKKSLPLAYEGTSDRVLLVLTSPLIDQQNKRASYYRFRISRSSDCSHQNKCQIDLSSYRIDAEVNSRGIQWGAATFADDDLTRYVADSVNSALDKFQEKAERQDQDRKNRAAEIGYWLLLQWFGLKE